MKHYYYKFLLAIIMMVCPVIASADNESFEVDDVKYTKLSDTTVEITYGGYHRNMLVSEDYVVPATVTYDNKTYKVTSIGYGAYANCGSFASVVIPEGVEFLATYSFMNCVQMKTITIPNTVKIIGDCAFEYCESLTDIIIPNSVTYIGEGAFRRCEKLTSLNIPKNVEYLGKDLLVSCSSIKSLSVEEGNKYYDSRDNCNAIIQKEGNVLLYGSASTVIPNTVDTIADNAFYLCLGLTEIYIPEGVKKIGRSAFCYCKNAQKLTIPNTVTIIEDWAFGECSSLYSIKVEDGNKYYDSRNNCNAIIKKEENKLILGCYKTSIPSDVSIIGEYAFCCSKNLTSVIIPENVTEIQSYAFTACPDLYSVVIKGNVKVLGVSAFSSCENLSSLTLNEGLESIGDYAFVACKIKSLDFPKSLKNIGYKAFSYCPITELSIPNYIKTIGNGAFYHCSELNSLTIEEGVTSIGNEAFSQCYSITSVVIPNTVTSIGNSAFRNCLCLASVTIPNSVTSIGNRAFMECSNLRSVTLPENITVISDSLFYRSDVDVTIPDNIISIGDFAFSSPSDSIVIPASVLNIGKMAFFPYKCVTNLAEVPQKLKENAFYDDMIPLHVRKGLKKLYEDSDWGKYFTIIDDLPASPLTPILANGSLVESKDIGKLTTFQLKTNTNVAINKNMRAKLYSDNKLIGEATFDDVTLSNNVMTIKFRGLVEPTRSSGATDVINTQIVIESGSINVDNEAYTKSLSYVYETSREIDELMTGIDEFAESITVVPNTTKRIVNGRLVIERNGKQYSLDGKAL